MNWIERMYDLKGKDAYSQNGESYYLEYVHQCLNSKHFTMFDIGGGDGFHLSNSRHLKNNGFNVRIFDKENGHNITVENCLDAQRPWYPNVISIDIDGNDYWVLNRQMPFFQPYIVICEFNPAFTDSRTIKYNPNHEWAGDDYYGFSFEAGKKLAEKHGYEVIFNVANMNLIMVRKDLIGDLYVPPVSYQQVKFFKESNRTDWEWI